jgi:hypothetical protein
MDNVVFIRENAFSLCPYLDIAIPDKVIGIRECAFMNCSRLRTDMPTSLKHIGHDAFDDNGLIDVKIPVGVKSINERAFHACGHLHSVEASDNVSSIGVLAFGNCPALINVSFPNLKTLGDYAFYFCRSLRSVTLSDQIESIGKNAFNNVTNCAINLVGHLTTDRLPVHGIVDVFAKMQSGGFGTVNEARFRFVPPVFAFSFTPGADVLDAFRGADLIAYINDVLRLTRADVPLLTNVPAEQSVLDLGDSVTNTEGLIHVDGSLIDIIKIGDVEYRWNGSVWVAPVKRPQGTPAWRPIQRID